MSALLPLLDMANLPTSSLAPFPARPEDRRRHQVAQEQPRVFLSADVATAIQIEVARQLAVLTNALGTLSEQNLIKALERAGQAG